MAYLHTAHADGQIDTGGQDQDDQGYAPYKVIDFYNDFFKSHVDLLLCLSIHFTQ